jgi:hypothetical protein
MRPRAHGNGGISLCQERRLMDQRRVRTSRLPPLSTRENPCLGAGGCRGGFVGGDLFRVSRYVSTGARELVRDIEKNAPLRRREKSFSSLFNLSLSVLRKLWKSFVWGFHTSGAIRRNQTQSGAIRRNQAQSGAIRRNQWSSLPDADPLRLIDDLTQLDEGHLGHPTHLPNMAIRSNQEQSA